MFGFHRHTWTEVQREYKEKGWLDYVSKSVTYKGWYTFITFQCTCQAYKQTELIGKVEKALPPREE